MKKLTVVIATLLMAFSLSASSIIISGNPTSDNVNVPLFNSGKTVSLTKFMSLKPSEYKEITGKKMTFKERISLKLFQHHFKNAINSDGTVNLKKFSQDQDDDDSFRIGWFLLGFLLGLIGLIIALIISDDNRHGRIKWTLIGWGTFVAILLIAAIASK